MENKEKFLYGASVQGIQSFIFQTNKLKEIAGASELVEEICTSKFAQEVYSSPKITYEKAKETLRGDKNAITFAAGNIKYIFESEADCQKVVLNFPKVISEFAPGITISQAVVKFKDDDFANAVNELENRLRPVVLSGDDLTLICRADLALEYTKTFIEEFENGTKKELGEIIEQNNVFEFGEVRDRLTACAGIAYIKSSYPFYYGYELAEALCTYAKKDAKDNDNIREGKELPQSCLMFHKVQDSFTENYDEISKRELQPHPDISFEFGPYYLREKTNRWTINELIDKADKLKGKEGNAVKSHLRNWMSLLYYNKEMAKQKLERLKSMTSMKEFINEVTDVKEERKRKVDNKTVTHYPVYDILAIHTINTQTTKKEKAKEVEL
jgi:hypothetical protein